MQIASAVGFTRVAAWPTSVSSIGSVTRSGPLRGHAFAIRRLVLAQSPDLADPCGAEISDEGSLFTRLASAKPSRAHVYGLIVIYLRLDEMGQLTRKLLQRRNPARFSPPTPVSKLLQQLVRRFIGPTPKFAQLPAHHVYAPKQFIVTHDRSRAIGRRSLQSQVYSFNQRGTFVQRPCRCRARSARRVG